MSIADLIAFLPELVILAGSCVVFLLSTGHEQGERARVASLVTAGLLAVTCALSLDQDRLLFDGAYRVDLFSQVLKLVLAVGYVMVLLAGGSLADIRKEVKAEYFLLLMLSVTGLVMLVSCVEVITLVIAMELSSMPLFLMIPMRRERAHHRNQMEAAAKYIMFGVAATGLMFFGLSYLFGLTGTLHLPELMKRLPEHLDSPVALVGLSLTFCGLYFKLAVFPFHYWSPDVYQGGACETVTTIASLPKIGAIAVLVRFVALAGPEHATVATMLGVVAVASMLYGNLIALVQDDVNRLLGFSAIAHAGYSIAGLVSLGPDGYAATLFYMVGYAVMAIACFTVTSRVSRDGENVLTADLSGLHKRSPLLAATMAVGVFGLAGLPPFAGFMGKLLVLKASISAGLLWLAVLIVINSALAIYYYLKLVREAYFKDAPDQPAIELPVTIRLLCIATILFTVLLGVLPAQAIDAFRIALPAALGL